MQTSCRKLNSVMSQKMFSLSKYTSCGGGGGGGGGVSLKHDNLGNV